MSPRDVESFLTKHATIIVYLLTLGMGVGMLKAEVVAKLDAQEFLIYKTQADGKMDAMLDILCTDHPNHRRCKR